ncbi:MAG: glycosyl hydrolase family 28-related protein [Thermoleophilia bacterium]
MLSRLLIGCVITVVALLTQAPLPPFADDLVAAATTSSIVVNVHRFGATGDGIHDDSRAVQRSIAAAAKVPGSTVYFPRGVYLCTSTTRLPDRVNLRGEGMGSSWLRGRLEFGSFNRISGLKIGDAGTCAVTNRPGAHGTRFSRCRLHGGGSTEGAAGSVLYLGGSQGNVRNVTFARCAIERTAYAPPAGVDAFAANVGNTITIHEFTHLPGDGHVEGITFRDCRLGAFNGRARGALRMMMEAFCWDGRTGLVYHGWKNLTFDGCTIEASDTTGLDFADRPLTSDPTRHASSGVLITGCTFRGARRHETYGHGGLPIVYECPTGIVVRDNTFYASPQEAIGGSWVGTSTTAPALLIQGNTFDMTRSPVGLEHESGQPCLSLVGYGSRVLGNTFRYNTGWGVLIKSGGGSLATVGNVVRGNTFLDSRTSDGEPTIKLADDLGRGCHDNRIVGNTIRNRGAGRRGVIYQSSGTGTNYATDNSIDCGASLPFVVVSGQIVRSGNRIF